MIFYRSFKLPADLSSPNVKEVEGPRENVLFFDWNDLNIHINNINKIFYLINFSYHFLQKNYLIYHIILYKIFVLNSLY